MAGNLAGMFNQINSAIQANPLNSPMGTGLLDGASQGLGGAMGAATGADPMSFMNQGGKQLEADKQLANLDLTKTEDMMKASQIYASLGQHDKAQAYAMDAKAQGEKEATQKVMGAVLKSEDPEAMEQAAQQLDAEGKYSQAEVLRTRIRAINSKNAAVLDAGQASIQEETARKKQAVMKTQALALAKKRGEKAAIMAIQSGALDGEEYLRKMSLEKRRTKTVAQDSILVDEDEGTVIATNPGPEDAPGTAFKLTGPDKVAMNKSQEAWQKHSQRATQAQSTADQISAMSEKSMQAGAFATVDELINGVTGTRDKASQLRTQYLNIQKSGIVQAMPSGPQSDNDVRIFSRGFPPENAGKDEIVAFLEAQARMAQKAADYEEMKVDFIGTGRQKDFIPAWKRRMEAEGRQESVAVTPPWAIEMLQANPGSEDAFLTEWGWLPTAEELADGR